MTETDNTELVERLAKALYPWLAQSEKADVVARVILPIIAEREAAVFAAGAADMASVHRRYPPSLDRPMPQAPRARWRL